jgi:hypothetical protein
MDAEGRFACVVYPGHSADAKKHRKRIFALCGNRETQPLCVRPTGGLGHSGRAVESQLVPQPLKIGLLGRLGRAFNSRLGTSEVTNAAQEQAVLSSQPLKKPEVSVLPVLKPGRELTAHERDILRRKGMANYPRIIEALNIFDGRIIE